MHKIRIPTVQYGYIEFDFKGSADEALQEHSRQVALTEKSLKSPPETLDSKTWNRILDIYLSENRITSDDYELLTASQRIIINEIKKSLNRINK